MARRLRKAQAIRMAAENSSRSFKVIAVVATALFILLGIIGNGPSTYRFAVFFLAPLLWAVYFLRHALHVHPVHFGVFAGALVFHNLGAFGAYRETYFGIEFDIYVHFAFGVAGTLLVARAVRFRFDLHGWQLWVGTILLMLGLSGIHELIEFASTLMLGPEKGMLKINDPDKFDTHKDLLNNLLGALLGLSLYTLGRRAGRQTRGADPDRRQSSAIADRA